MTLVLVSDTGGWRQFRPSFVLADGKLENSNPRMARIRHKDTVPTTGIQQYSLVTMSTWQVMIGLEPK